MPAKALIKGGRFLADGWSLSGATLTTHFTWVVGGKFSTVGGTMPGADITAEAMLLPAVIKPREIAVIGAGTQLTGGKFTLTGTPPGGVLSAAAAVSGGAFTLVARNIGGAALAATASINGGISGDGPKGADFTAAAGGAVGGFFGAVQKGAVVTAQQTLTPGVISFSGNDPHFSSVSLLLNFEDNYNDASSNNLTPYGVNNSPEVTTAQRKFGSKGLRLNPNPGSVLTYRDRPELYLPGDYTLQGHIFFTTSNEVTVFSDFGNNSALVFNKDISGSVYLKTATNQTIGPIATGVQINQWNYFHILRSGNTTRIYIEGQKIGADNTYLTNAMFDTWFVIGASTNTSEFYLDNIRITKNVARSDFTPPGTPFPTS